MNTFGLSFVGRFVLFWSVLYQRFQCSCTVEPQSLGPTEKVWATEKSVQINEVSRVSTFRGLLHASVYALLCMY